MLETRAKKTAIYHSKILGSSDGKPNQSFPSEMPPYFVWVRETERKGWARWRRVKSFSGSTGESRHYTLDRSAGSIRFGDGERGLVPPQGKDNIKATYRRASGNADGR